MPLEKGSVGPQGPTEGASLETPEDTHLSKTCPTLEEFIRCPTWSDGSKRETASLMIFCEGGKWKGMLNDRESNCIAFTSSETLNGVLKALEKGLTGNTLDWRVSKAKKGR